MDHISTELQLRKKKKKKPSYLATSHLKLSHHLPFDQSLYLKLLSSVHGEGNGIPLQFSCLENPMDGGAW